ncbi:hypothetical protein HDU82_007197 [Entophlyctis luteolus]|nr:hypothetical protein HDU82_007197 [Entophlyctis luteolus]KAJ3390096.1 hypothetical protein HDU84_007921 [Entophlyctis sp. JEL0112]
MSATSAPNNIVAIPSLTHSTVEQILAINSHIIKILAKYQNFGWIDEPEYKIYQARLQSNLTFLATAADYMGKPEPSKLNALMKPINLSPVEIPAKLRDFNESKQKINLAIDPSAGDDTVNTGTRGVYIDGQRWTNTIVFTDAQYQPVAPFFHPGILNAMNGTSAQGALPGISPPNILGTSEAGAEMQRRFGDGAQ